MKPKNMNLSCLIIGKILGILLVNVAGAPAGKRENDAAGDAAGAVGDAASLAIPGVGEAKAVMEVADKALDLAGKFDSMNEAMVHKYAAAVERKPADLISEAAMNAGMKAISEGGAKEIEFDPLPGFQGQEKYQNPGWKMRAKQSDPIKRKDKPPEEAQYTRGVGFALLNGCFLPKYDKSSPCYNAVAATPSLCLNVHDSANFIGVGFNGRGRYNSDSRRQSLIRRRCKNKKKFLDRQVPDCMNAFGIYDYAVKFASYSSTESYVAHLIKQSGASQTSNMFEEEKSSYQETNSGGGGILGLGSAGYGESHGGSKSSQHGLHKSSSHSEQHASQQSKRSSTMMAVCEINLKLFELALDVVTPDDLSQPFLRDFIGLPPWWQAVGAMDKLQGFIIRYGTHYITSAKFGGQLKIIKTAKSSSTMSEEQFSAQSQQEVSEMFGQTSNSFSQNHAEARFLGIGGEHSGKSQSGSSKKTQTSSNSVDKTSGGHSQSSSSKQSKTSLEVKGGDMQIAKAVMDFYSPSFRGDMVEWLESIPRFPKPYQFTMRKVTELLDINADAMFGKDMKLDCGALPKDYSKNGGVCEQHELEHFKELFKARRESLERAEIIYMAEGPYDTSSFDVEGGEIGCETNYLEYETGDFELPKTWPSWRDMTENKIIFKVSFSLPEDLSFLPFDAELEMKMSGADKGRLVWMYKYPDGSFSFDNMCPLTDMYNPMLCVADLGMRYDEESGIIKFNRDASKYLDANETRLLYQDMPIGTVTQMGDNNAQLNQIYKLPCGVQWTNAHRIDYAQESNCVHFTASTRGSIYVVFSEIPKDKQTWYYVHITSRDVSFYQYMKLAFRVVDRGIGTLGDDRLYESFFVCVSQAKDKSNDTNNERWSKKPLEIVYGKTTGELGRGDMKAAFKFKDSEKDRLSFFAFGTGHVKLSVEDMHVTNELPKYGCPKDYRPDEVGSCELDCHPQCHLCYKADDDTACLSCRVYENYIAEGKRVCVPECPVGKWVKGKKCERCGLGTKWVNGACVPCEKGHYQNKKGSTTCRKCPQGTYSNTTGNQRCTQCAVHYFQNRKGQLGCLKCPNNSRSQQPGTVNCDINCPAGQYLLKASKKAERNKTSSMYLVAGKSTDGVWKRLYAGTSLANEKVRLLINTTTRNHHSEAPYVGVKGCTLYDRNPGDRGNPNSMSDPAAPRPSKFGLVESHGCNQPAVYFNPFTHNKLLPGVNGMYLNQKPVDGHPVEGVDKHDEDPLQPGKYLSGEKEVGIAYSDRMELISFSTGQIWATCNLWYCTDAKDIRCITPNCKGKYYNKFYDNGAERINYGRQLKRRQRRETPQRPLYKDKITLQLYPLPEKTGGCEPASPGHFVDKATMKRERMCKPGTYQEGTAALSCKKCEKGTHSALEGEIKCHECGKDFYQDKKGQRYCKACPDGETALKPRSTKCYAKCPKGHYHSEDDPEACLACPQGRYASKTGLETCERCKPGFRQSRMGQRSCTQVAQFKVLDWMDKKQYFNGTLMVKYHGRWGAVCAPPPGKDAVAHFKNIVGVVCKMQGYRFGRGDMVKTKRPIVWDNVICSPADRDIFDCKFHSCHPNCDENCQVVFIDNCHDQDLKTFSTE